MCQQAFFGDTKTTGRARSPLLERYTRRNFGGLNQKNPSELSARAARGQTVPGKIDAKNEDDEDEKLIHRTGAAPVWKLVGHRRVRALRWILK